MATDNITISGVKDGTCINVSKTKTKSFCLVLSKWAHLFAIHSALTYM